MKYLLDGQETERLKFRLLKPTDFELWIDIFKHENVALHLGLNTQLSTHKLCEAWFTKIFNRYENGLGGMNVLIDKNTNKFIGQSGLLIQEVENIERLEIAYSILPQFWNMGFATEAATKCKNYAFKTNLSQSLISIVHINNIGSAKVAIKNGMTIEKRLDAYKGIPVNIFSIDNST